MADGRVLRTVGDVDRVIGVIHQWAPSGAEVVVDFDRVRFLAPGFDVVVYRLNNPWIDDAVTQGTDPVYDVVVWAAEATIDTCLAAASVLRQAGIRVILDVDDPELISAAIGASIPVAD